MGDEFRRLPSEHKIVRGMVGPAAHRLFGRRAVEHPVQFRGEKVFGVVFEVQPDGQIIREERSSPRAIAPPRGSDQYSSVFRHGSRQRYFFPGRNPASTCRAVLAMMLDSAGSTCSRADAKCLACSNVM